MGAGGSFDAAQDALSNWLQDAVASWMICPHLEISDDRRQFLLEAVVEECHQMHGYFPIGVRLLQAGLEVHLSEHMQSSLHEIIHQLQHDQGVTDAEYEGRTGTAVP